MKAKKVMSTGLLVICGVVVLSTISGGKTASAGELIDDVLASIEQSSPELASAFENILAIPEVEDLVSTIESYFQQNGKIDNKQDGCQWHTPYSSICEFLDDLNDCADWLEDQIPNVKLADIIISEFSHLPYLQALAPLLTDSLMKSFSSKEDEIYFCDREGKCPSWYYHFWRGRVGFSPPTVDPNNTDPRRSFVRITYASDAGDVPGALVFYVTEPNWEHKVIPVVWRASRGNVQKVTLSCYIDFFDNDGHILDELARLMLLISYWTVTDTKALDTLQNKDYYFGPWFMLCILLIEIWTRGEGYNGYADIPSQAPLGTEAWDFTRWPASPLLVLTDEWYYSIWRDNKHPDYFDHIMLWVSPQAGDGNIEISEIEVNLNGRRILYFRPLNPLVFNRNSPLDLSEAIKTYRLLYVAEPANCSGGDCWLPRSVPPSVVDILKAASQDYAQGWDYRYGVKWEKEDSIWRPLPAHGWCGTYACYILSKYMQVPAGKKTCIEYVNDPHSPTPMGSYFNYLGSDYHISYDDGYEWDSLKNRIKPGYYVNMQWNWSEQKGEYTNSHGAFFIDWVKDMAPGDDNKGCGARFYIIGGNQSYGRVSVDEAAILNILNTEKCTQSDFDKFKVELYNVYWAPYGNPEGYGWFGRTD